MIPYFDIILIIFLFIFTATAVFTLLALPGWIQIGESFKKRLFNILLVEVILSVFTLFATYKNGKYFQVHDDIENPAIWAGFTNTYRAYNDSWILEMAHPLKYVQVHRDRFGDPEDSLSLFKYIFYIDEDNYNFESFERFVRFQAMVHLYFELSDVENIQKFENEYKKIKDEGLPITLKKIKVYLIYTTPPGLTYFVGQRDSPLGYKKNSIIYLSLDASIAESRPYQILTTEHEGLFSHLTNHWETAINGQHYEEVSGEQIFEKYFAMRRF